MKKSLEEVQQDKRMSDELYEDIYISSKPFSKLFFLKSNVLVILSKSKEFS